MADRIGSAKPLVEIYGTKRVLIEHHCGVKEYSDRRIGIKVSYGCILVQGQELCLAKISKEQIVITGTVNQVNMCMEERNGAVCQNHRR